jgi:RNA polymerase sigma-70 factor, ECF subfamily
MRYGKAGSMILAEENMNTGEAAATAAAAVTKAGPRVSWNINPTAWVDDHGDFLFRYALMRLRDETAAEDLVQETLLAAIQSLASYAGKSSERTWLTSILKHKIIDYYRRQARETTFGDSSAAADADLSSFDRFFERDDEWNGHWNERFAPSANWNMSPEAALEQSEFFDVLENCISKLPEKAAGVFALREMDGLESSEICEIMRLSPSNFWVMMHRARMALRRCIEINWFIKVSR